VKIFSFKKTKIFETFDYVHVKRIFSSFSLAFYFSWFQIIFALFISFEDDQTWWHLLFFDSFRLNPIAYAFGGWKGLTWVDNFVYPWNFLNIFFTSFLHEKLEQWSILFFFAIVCKVWLNVVLTIMIVIIVVHYLFNILDCFQYSQFCGKCN